MQARRPYDFKRQFQRAGFGRAEEIDQGQLGFLHHLLCCWTLVASFANRGLAL